MIRYLYSLILLTLPFVVCAQDNKNQKNKSPKISLNEYSVVTDSAGVLYPYLVWSSFMETGNYSIRPIDSTDKKTSFLLVRLSDAEKKRMMESFRPPESKYFKTGEQLRIYKMTDVDNIDYTKENLKGKIVVINFWFINCPPCRKEIPELNDLVQDYAKDSSVVFLALARDERKELNNFSRDNRFDYKIIYSAEYLAMKYGIKSFPTNLIIDKDGKVYFHSSGYSLSTVYWLRKSIEELKTVAATR